MQSNINSAGSRDVAVGWLAGSDTSTATQDQVGHRFWLQCVGVQAHFFRFKRRLVWMRAGNSLTTGMAYVKHSSAGI